MSTLERTFTVLIDMDTYTLRAKGCLVGWEFGFSRYCPRIDPWVLSPLCLFLSLHEQVLFHWCGFICVCIITPPTGVGCLNETQPPWIDKKKKERITIHPKAQTFHFLS